MVQRDSRTSSAVGPLAEDTEFSSVREGGAQFVSRNAIDDRGPITPGRWRQERARVSPDVSLESARKRVSGLEAAIAAMIANGMDENSAEVKSFRVSLTQAKRKVQEAPLEVQVKGAQDHNGVALEEARRKKERTYPEFAGDNERARLVVLAAEVGGANS